MLVIYLLSCCCLIGAGGSDYREYGIATYYGDEFHGKKTASGEVYNKYEFTCAHRKLPFGTKLKVTNMKNKKSVIVKVNDRGPWVKGRIVDLSYAAAKKIGMIADGLVKVKIEIIK